MTDIVCSVNANLQLHLRFTATQGDSDGQAALGSSSSALQLELVLVCAQGFAAQLQASIAFSHQQWPVRHIHICRRPSWHCNTAGNHDLLAGAGNCHDHLCLEGVADGHCLTHWTPDGAFQLQCALQAGWPSSESQVVEDVLPSSLVLEGDTTCGLALNQGVEMQLTVFLGQSGYINMWGYSQLGGWVRLLQVNDHLEALGLVEPVGQFHTLYMGLLGRHLPQYSPI